MKDYEVPMKRSRAEYSYMNSVAASPAMASMPSLDLQRLKEGFVNLLRQVEPELMPAFLIWIDHKVAEYKIHGYMFEDRDNKHEGPWLKLAVDVLKFRFGGPSSVEARNTQPKRDVREKPVDMHSASQVQLRGSASNGRDITSGHSHGSQPSPRDRRVDLSHTLSQQHQSQSHSLHSNVSIPSFSQHSASHDVSRKDLSLVEPHLSGDATGHSAPYDLSISRVKKEPSTPVKANVMPTPVNASNQGYNYSTPPKLVASPRPQEAPENLSTYSAPSHALANHYPILSQNLNKQVPYDSRDKPQVRSVPLELAPVSVALKMPTMEQAATDYSQMSKLIHEHAQISKLASEHAHISKLRSLTPEKMAMPEPVPEHTQISKYDVTASAIKSEVMAVKKIDFQTHTMKQIDFSTSTPEKHLEVSMDGDPSFLQSLNPASPNSPNNTGKSPKSHICPVCDKCFPYSSSFRRHMKLHQGVYTHVCAVCHRKFTRKEHFVRHKCNRRPNKPCRGLEGEVKPSVTGKVPKVAYPPAMPSEPFNLENKENNSVLNQTGGHQMDSYEAFDTPESTASPTPSQPGGESRRKSSKPRRCVQTDEETAVTNSILDEDEEANSVDSDQDSEPELVIDMSREKEDDSTKGSPQSVEGRQTERGHFQEAWTEDPQMAAAPIKNGVPSPMVHPREASSPGSVLPHAEDMSALQHGHTSETMTGKDKMADHMQQAQQPEAYTSPKYRSSSSPAEQMTVTQTAPSGEEEGKGDVLSLETGNYVVATVEDEGEVCAEDQPSPGKFIKVTKQSNYLKLQKEMRMIGGKPCFVCPNCSKVFHRSSNFSRHMRIHRGVFSYVCPTCNRGFFRKEHFQKHKCNRKAMSYVWERKTKVDMDMQKTFSEDGCNDSEGPVDDDEYGVDINDYSMEESGESSTDEPLENSNHSNTAIAISNQGGHSNGGITMPIPIAVPVE